MDSDGASKYVELLLDVFDPLIAAAEDPDEARLLLIELGYLPPVDVNAFNVFAAGVSKLDNAINGLNDASQNNDESALLEALLGILAAGGELFRGVNDLSSAIQSNFAGTGLLTDTDILTAIARKTADYLVVRFLEDNFETICAGLLLIGVIDIEEIAIAQTSFQAPYIKRTVNWDQLASLFSDPLSGLKGNLADSNGIRYQRLVYFLYLLGVGVDRYSQFLRPDIGVLTTFNDGNDLTALIPPDPSGPVSDGRVLTPISGNNPFSSLRFPLLSDPAGTLALAVYPTVDPATKKYTGVGVGIAFGGELQIPLSDAFQLDVAFSPNLSDSLGVRLDSQGNFTFINKIFTSNPESLANSLNFDVRVRIVPTAAGPADPLFALEVPQGTRVQIRSGDLTIGFAKQDSFRVFAEANVKNVQFALATSEADNFLSSLLPQGGTQTNFDIGVGFSNQRGFYFTGGSNFSVLLPLHLSLGPIQIEDLQIAFGVANNSLPLTVSISFSAVLGPIAIDVEDIGVKATVTTVLDRTGNFGPLDIGFGFKFPSGLGLAIDAGAVAGGGFILFDQQKKEYAGVFNLALVDIIQVTIIGILDTVLPDGSKGYSFLFIITFNFPPIQLGFGFTLNGVGGIGGVNRTMSIPALQAGFHSNSLNSVMFPADPISRAPKIISDVSSYFPPAQGRYLFGPLLQVGWETLVKLTVGVILEVPDPIRLVLLGLIDAGLPTVDVSLVEIHIEVLGTIDFGTKKFSLDGSLYHSRVLQFTLLGDLALRVSWGDTPNFLFSLGGFNPHFNTTGLDVPSMHRLSISIGNGDNPRISANSYLALTSNTAQFGASVEAYASAGDFSVHGYLGFDVLFTFSPYFSFEFDFSANFDVSFHGNSLAGLNVNGTLTGPTPWHLHGDATIHILFFSVGASVDLTWGNSQPAALPQKSVWADLGPALADPSNWSASLPGGMTPAVSVTAPKPSNNSVYVHPSGTLTVREKVVPLDAVIALYNNDTPSDGDKFSIKNDVTVNGSAEQSQSIQDKFAAAQFFNLSDADKLSAPSFEPYDAGVTITFPAVTSGGDVPRTVKYREFYIDDFLAPARLSSLPYSMPNNIQTALTRQGASYVSAVKNTGFAKYRNAGGGPAISTKAPSYVVAGVQDLSVRGDIAPATGSNYFQTRAALAAYTSAHPGEAGDLRILATHEVVP